MLNINYVCIHNKGIRTCLIWGGEGGREGGRVWVGGGGEGANKHAKCNLTLCLEGC